MKTIALAAAAALLSVGGALAQPAPAPAVALESGVTLLNVTAEGRAYRQPDLANFNAGVVTQARTAGEAMSANAARMEAIVAALKRAGIAERDIQTSNLNLQPQYHYPQRQRVIRQPSGETTVTETEPQAPRIIGYEARNTVSVRVRRVGNMGRIIDTLVSAGANQVEGPYFTLEDQEAATNEARADAMKNARARAELYARAAGLRVGRILTISEGGGYYPLAREAIVVTAQSFGGAGAPPPPPPPPAAPVQPGELALGVSLSVQFALER